MDDFTRGPDKLDVNQDQQYDFEFKPAGFCGGVLWAWNATEMGYRIASRIAVISLVSGLLALLLGICQ